MQCVYFVSSPCEPDTVTLADDAMVELISVCVNMIGMHKEPNIDKMVRHTYF